MSDTSPYLDGVYTRPVLFPPSFRSSVYPALTTPVWAYLGTRNLSTVPRVIGRCVTLNYGRIIDGFLKGIYDLGTVDRFLVPRYAQTGVVSAG